MKGIYNDREISSMQRHEKWPKLSRTKFSGRCPFSIRKPINDVSLKVLATASDEREEQWYIHFVFFICCKGGGGGRGRRFFRFLIACASARAKT